MRLDAYAERFAQAGFHALVFDYRHFGDSEGEPRQLLDIKKQHQDWQAAIDHARAIPGADPRNLTLWGTSFSGGHVVAMGVKNPDVAAVISQVPHLNGLATAMAAGLHQNIRLGRAAIRDWTAALLGSPPYYVPPLGLPGELAAMTCPGEKAAAQKLYPDDFVPDERVAARIFLTVARYSPGRLAQRLRAPWLVQVARKDRTTPMKPAVRAARKAPRSRLIIYDAGHFDVYVPPLFEITVNDQIQFLKDHLSPSLATREQT